MKNRVVPLKSQTTQLNIVIRKNKVLGVDKVKAYCERYFKKYAFIEHKNDVCPSTGLVEGCHYHIVGDTIDKGVSLFTRINQIKDFFKFEDDTGIEIDKYSDYVGSIQYLIHKNNREKTPHKIEEVVHNLDKADLTLIMNAEKNEVITFDLLYGIINKATCILDIIKELGLKNYKDYRNTIWDMWKCVRAYKRGQDDDTIL